MVTIQPTVVALARGSVRRGTSRIISRLSFVPVVCSVEPSPSIHLSYRPFQAKYRRPPASPIPVRMPADADPGHPRPQIPKLCTSMQMPKVRQVNTLFGGS